MENKDFDAGNQPTLEVMELDQRENDRLVVTLWWVKGTLDTYVTVVGAYEGDSTFIPVPEGTPPHEVYYHPFAFIENPESQ